MPPVIKVLGTGGTIASTRDEGGASPTEPGAALLDAVPGLDAFAEVDVEQVAQVPSFELDVDTVATIGRRARQAIADGADGVVVTHGTDTMESSAYYLDLALDIDAPVVFTGAQRRPDELSPDGPANLRTAVRVATDDRFRTTGGVYVAFDQQVHAARDVRKMHTSALDTFQSPETGPVAVTTRDSIRHFRQPGSYADHIPVLDPDARIAVVTSDVGVDDAAIRAAQDRGVDGIVVEATGLGNTTAPLGRAIADVVDAGTPVVVASRCPAGSVTPVYGGDGGGETLREHGAIFAGDLPAHKARIKLMLACDQHAGIDGVRQRFE
ncbi:asparaginase [Halomicrococcus sp. NG-SE-24]|uniref:asparaginase n=1 Tax=Halomicrococcus sp. NG-SE-24 TaxID=3436928 RepID=UPI003D97CA54